MKLYFGSEVNVGMLMLSARKVGISVCSPWGIYNCDVFLLRATGPDREGNRSVKSLLFDSS